MATAPKNLYHRRQVAESSAKACWICYKPSSTVLITPEQDDWFHLCSGHLIDTKFAIPKDGEDLAKKKHEEAVQKEIDALKKEWEEKVAKKLAKKKGKDAAAGGEEKKKKEEKDDAEEEKEKDEQLKALEEKKKGAAGEAAASKVTIDGPRIFELQKQFFQMRLQKKREAEMARRNLQRLQTPDAFPSVPSGRPGS
jgi:hypothetical protein